MFPTTVGMNRSGNAGAAFKGSVPHDCGDEPNYLFHALSCTLCSPRLWG